MRKIGLGIIGLGHQGSIHLRHALGFPNVSIVAVADMSKKTQEKARALGAKKAYSDYESLLRDPEIDAVVIALPTHLHASCAEQAAEAKKHIFLEKPMARNVAEAERILSATQRNSVKLMIGYPLRFGETFLDLKEKIQRGILGDVEIAYATNIGSGPFAHQTEGYAPVPVPEWWFSKELSGGGVLMDLGCHMINLARWYFGEIVDIRGNFGYRFNLDFEDRATCLAKFESGPLVVINVGWFSQVFKLELELFGSANHIMVQRSHSNPLVTMAQMLASGTSKLYWPFQRELQYFTKCVIEDKSPSPSGLDGLRDLEAITKAYKNSI